MEPKFKGIINPISGNPELYHDGRLVAVGTYYIPVLYISGMGSYMVFSHYWENVLPRDMIGVALKVTKV